MRLFQRRNLASTILTRKKSKPALNQTQNNPSHQRIHLQSIQQHLDVCTVNKATSRYHAETIQTYPLKIELKEFGNTRLAIVVLKVHTSVGIVKGMNLVTSMVAGQFTIQVSMAMDAYGKRQPSEMKCPQEMQAEKNLLWRLQPPNPKHRPDYLMPSQQ